MYYQQPYDHLLYTLHLCLNTYGVPFYLFYICVIFLFIFCYSSSYLLCFIFIFILLCMSVICFQVIIPVCAKWMTSGTGYRMRWWRRCPSRWCCSRKPTCSFTVEEGEKGRVVWDVMYKVWCMRMTIAVRGQSLLQRFLFIVSK